MALTDILFLNHRRRPLGARITRMLQIARQRRDLSKLEPHLLKDIGVTQDDARIEAARPPWDAPDFWTR